MSAHFAEEVARLRLPDPREKPWLTVAELAQIAGEGEKAIRSAIAAGHIPHMQVGRYVRIPTAALLAQLGIAAESTTAAEPASSTTVNVHPIAPARNGCPDGKPAA